MNIKRPLCLIAGGFVLGETVVLLSLANGLVISALIAAGVCFVYLAFFSGVKSHNRRGRSALWLLLLLFFVFLGMTRAYGAKRDWERREELCEVLSGRYLEAGGRLAVVEETAGKMLLTLKDNRVRPIKRDGQSAKDTVIPCILVSLKTEEAGGGDALRIGMQLTVKGELKPFAEARNPGEFDYRNYYQALGVDCRMDGEMMEVSDDSDSLLPELLRRVRQKAGRTIKQAALPEEAGIFTAAVLGDKTELSAEVKDLYQKNGIAHLLAISGLHLSIIGMGVYRLLRKAGLKFGTAGLAGTVFIVCYGLMSGGSPSVVRAVAMMSACFLASYLGRTYDFMSAACMALILLAWRSPYLLMQGGVQLSFGAVFAVGGVFPVLITWLGKEGRWAAALAVSIAIQLMTLPIILCQFFQFPVYGVFLNLLVIPLMGGVICSGIGAAIVGGISMRAGIAVLGLGHYILRFYEYLCHVTELLPYHTLVMGRPAGRTVVTYYVVLAAVLYGMNRINRGRDRGGKDRDGKGRDEKDRAEGDGEEARGVWTCGRFMRPAALLCLGAVFPLLLVPRPVEGLKAAFLDVGQGDGILLRSGRCAILIDGGSTSEKMLGQYRLEPCLKSYGISVIDYAFVSHGDQDHWSGVQYLLESCEEIQIKNLILSCQGKEDPALLKLAELAEKRGTLVSFTGSGDRYTDSGILVTCLYPGPADLPSDTNEESEVLKVDYGNCHMLFTGDMSGAGELNLLEKMASNPGVLSEIQILKTAHHGSRFSSCGEFLDALGTEWAVISYAKGNSYGHPHQEVLDRMKERGIGIYRTAEGGAVLMQTDGRTVNWSMFDIVH